MAKAMPIHEVEAVDEVLTPDVETPKVPKKEVAKDKSYTLADGTVRTDN